MAESVDYLKSKDQIKANYEILTVSHPKIEVQYGTISIVKVQLNNKENKTTKTMEKTLEIKMIKKKNSIFQHVWL